MRFPILPPYRRLRFLAALSGLSLAAAGAAATPATPGLNAPLAPPTTSSRSAATSTNNVERPAKKPEAMNAKPPAAASAHRSRPAADAGAHLIAGISYHGQVYTEDCESAALQMALAHEGIKVSQAKLLSTEHLSLAPPLLDSAGKVVRWGDPYVSFVGEPNSASISTYYEARSGYGTYAPNIARVAARFGGQVLWEGTGFTRAQLEKAISHDHPVIAWVGDRDGRMLWAPLASWRAWDGRTVVYPAPSSGVYEHTVLVSGFSKKGVYVDDPLDGAKSGSNVNPVVGPGWVSWSSFLAGFRTFHGMAVVLR